MFESIKKNKNCLICGSGRLKKFLDLGKTALANSYVKKSDLKKPEMHYPLRVFLCQDCYLVQLTDIVSRKILFEKYAYFSAASPQLESHFEKYAKDISQKFPDLTKGFVLEIASNDGILLKYFKKMDFKILGVDPARNIARQANNQGIKTLPIFFNLPSAKKILKKYGKAQIILANNVLAHTDNPHNIIEGVKELLTPDGIFVFETQYLGDLLSHNEFDNIYHEHTCYFSLSPLITLLKKHGLAIFDVQRIPTQGGSLRVFAGHEPLIYPQKNSVKKLLLEEKQRGLYDSEIYEKFGKKPKKIKNQLVSLLKKIKRQKKIIAGYGAPAKGNTLLQYANIGPELIDYIVDNSPSKQKKYTPRTNIPIFSPEKLKKNSPDYVLLLAWNYAESIMEREKWLKEKGVKFIKPIPDVKVI